MALLINKLFSNKKKIYNRHTDVGDRTFSFTKEQVRVVLFRECDFRGRKLLFDSQTVQKVPLTSNKSIIPTASLPNQPTKTDVFVEISNGYGYQYSKPSNDTVILGETVFGSVAMSYQGTSFKIHSFTTPRKLMCTLVFPSPKVRVRSRVSVTNSTSTSNSSGVVLEKSEKLDYSSTSSVTSYQEPSSGHSTDSDIKNVSTAGSVPLDVPLISGDSGFYGDQSCSSMSSGVQSLMLLDGRLEHANMLSFSCGSLYKRWFRSASTSLDNSHSDVSLGVGGTQNSASADDCLMRNHHRSSKLGLAIILQLTEHKENEMESFLLKHAALIEAMVSRARIGTENAYNKPILFASLMCEIHQEICQYLSDLLTGNFLKTYLWHEIGTKQERTYEKPNFLGTSLFNFNYKTKSENNLVKLCEKDDKRTRTESFRSDIFSKSVNNSFSELKNSDIEICDNKKHSVGYKKNYSSHFADNFIKEFCEILEMFEVKQTNFFISTLLTAVLTHHLGWVSTVLPPSQEDKNVISKMQNPCNPLWGQLSDLYGAVGHPTKMSRTIICGSNKGEIIDKILNILTYFIRCTAVEKNCLRSFDVCDLNLSSVEEQIPKNIPFRNQKSDYKLELINKPKENDSTKNLEQQFEMKTLKVPNNEEPTKVPTIKSHSNSSIEKTSNYLQPGLKSMKKSTSYVGNLCFQSGNLSNNFKDFESTNKNEVVFVLGENEELKNLKRSTESVNRVETLVEENAKVEKEKLSNETCSNILSNKKTFTDLQNDNTFVLDKRKQIATKKNDNPTFTIGNDSPSESNLVLNPNEESAAPSQENISQESDLFISVPRKPQPSKKFQIGSFENDDYVSYRQNISKLDHTDDFFNQNIGKNKVFTKNIKSNNIKSDDNVNFGENKTEKNSVDETDGDMCKNKRNDEPGASFDDRIMKSDVFSNKNGGEEMKKSFYLSASPEEDLESAEKLLKMKKNRFTVTKVDNGGDFSLESEEKSVRLRKNGFDLGSSPPEDLELKEKSLRLRKKGFNRGSSPPEDLESKGKSLKLRKNGFDLGSSPPEGLESKGKSLRLRKNGFDLGSSPPDDHETTEKPLKLRKNGFNLGSSPSEDHESKRKSLKLKKNRFTVTKVDNGNDFLTNAEVQEKKSFCLSSSPQDDLKSKSIEVQEPILDDDALNIPSSSKMNRPTDLKLPKKLFTPLSDSSPDSPSPLCPCADISPCSECEKMRQRSSSLHLSDNNKIVLARSSKIQLETDFDDNITEIKRREGFDRSQSVPPSDKKRKCSKAGCKKKYAGVKFDMRQYPQIVTQYMKSKDLELSQLPFGDKSLKLNRSFSTILYDNCIKDFPSCDCEHDTEVLTTPSNASELEFTSDLECDKYEFFGTKPKTEESFDIEKPSTSSEGAKINSVVVIEHPLQENVESEDIFEQEVEEEFEKEEERCSNMVYSEFYVPRIDVEKFPKNDSSVGYTHTLLRGINNNYVSDMVLQGTTSPLNSWEHILKRDLKLTARQPLLDQPIQEAVAIVANTDTWEVQLISSHSYVVERGCAGVRICLSQLVANMLESLLHMWKLRTPTEYCLMHIESKLREFCLHSKTMAQILMNTEFCNMDNLTSALQLEVNDIPLLMAIASTHTPQVTQKYGLSFQ